MPTIKERFAESLKKAGGRFDKAIGATPEQKADRQLERDTREQAYREGKLKGIKQGAFEAGRQAGRAQGKGGSGWGGAVLAGAKGASEGMAYFAGVPPRQQRPRTHAHKKKHSRRRRSTRSNSVSIDDLIF